MPGVGRAGLSPSVSIRPTPTGSTISATTCMNGVSTGTTPATTATLPNEIRKGLPTLAAEPPEEAPGGTTLRLPALRRDRVFRQSSNTPTTVSESRDPRSPETVLGLASKTSLSNAHHNRAGLKDTLREVILFLRVGAGGEAVGKAAGPFRGLRAIGGQLREAARQRYRRR